MPQMSPLGWVWLIAFVSFGYVMFLVLFYSMFLSFIEFSFYLVGLSDLSWLW